MLTAHDYAVRVVRDWPGVRNGDVLEGLDPTRRDFLLRAGFVEAVEATAPAPARPRRRRASADDEPAAPGALFDGDAAPER